VAIATHDEALIRRSLSLLQRLGTPPTGYEFQMLLGVLPRLRRRLLGDGHRLRVYVPYGEQWYAYCVRRLRENPAMGRQVLRAMFARG
jgi:proline dehydrogenase